MTIADDSLDFSGFKVCCSYITWGIIEPREMVIVC